MYQFCTAVNKVNPLFVDSLFNFIKFKVCLVLHYFYSLISSLTIQSRMQDWIWGIFSTEEKKILIDWVSATMQLVFISVFIRPYTKNLAITWLAFYKAFTWIFIQKSKQWLTGKGQGFQPKQLPTFFLVNARQISNCYCWYKRLCKRLCKCFWAIAKAVARPFTYQAIA